MKRKLVFAIIVALLTLPLGALACDTCEPQPDCTTGNCVAENGYAYVNTEGWAWGDASPNGHTAAFSSGQYNMNFQYGDEMNNFTGNLSGGYLAESEGFGVPSWAEGGAGNWAEWGNGVNW